MLVPRQPCGRERECNMQTNADDEVADLLTNEWEEAMTHGNPLKGLERFLES
jgi:hypothetical protein